MASAISFGRGVIIFFISIFLSILLFISIVYPAERVLSAFETIDIGADGATIYDVPAPWDMGYADALFWMNFLYVVCILPASLGTFILFISAIKTQSYDTTTSDPQQPDQFSDYGGNGGSAPMITVPQYKKGFL